MAGRSRRRGGVRERAGRTSRSRRAGGGPAASLRQPRQLSPGDHHRRPARPGVLRPGPAPRLRLQPRRGGARVPRGGPHRSRLRHVLLGHRAQPGVQLQQPHRRGSRARGLRSGADRARARGEGEPARAGHHRGAGPAALDGEGREPCRPRPRLCRRHARGGAPLSRRPRRRHALRGRAHEPPALGSLDHRRAARAGHRRGGADARAGARSQPGASRRQPPLHPRGGGQHRARTGRGRGRSPRHPRARRRASRAHALAHLLPHRTLRRRVYRQRAGGGRGSRVLRSGPGRR